MKHLRHGLMVGAVAILAGCSGSPRIGPGDAAAGSTSASADSLTPAQRVVALAGDASANPDARRKALLRITESTAADAPVYLAFYRAILADPRTDPTVAAVCGAALANHGQPEDARHLTPLLTDSPEAFARWQAAMSLQRLHHSDAIGPLMQATGNDEDADVRAAAANALGQYARRDVFDTLVIALDDPDAGVAREARGVLAGLTGQDVGDDPRAWLDLADAARRGNATSLFDLQPYTFTPYPPSRGTLGWVLFFLPPTQATPQTPRGF